MRVQKTIVGVMVVATYILLTRLHLGYIFRFVAAGPPTEGIHAYYDLGIELGKGSFASVYKAMHRVSGECYAVKMIQADKVKRTAANGNDGNVDPRKATAFAREISILEQLSHPNICQLKETFFDNVHHNISETFAPSPMVPN
jgi:serine/threonine/tyrosine protein kinase RAD53